MLHHEVQENNKIEAKCVWQYSPIKNEHYYI